VIYKISIKIISTQTVVADHRG